MRVHPEDWNQMDPWIDPDACVGCQSCVNICPVNAAVYVPQGMVTIGTHTSYTHARARIEVDFCIECGACEPECPYDAVFGNFPSGSGGTGGNSGGGTSPPVYTSDVVENLTNPCLKGTFTAITNTGKVNNKVNNLIQEVFNKNDQVNLVYNESTELPTSRLAETLPVVLRTNQGGGKVYDISVNLNVNVLPGYSRELTAVTILHEALHAYFNYAGAFANQALEQHMLMATKYVDILRDSIKSVYPNLQDKHANMLILSQMADIYTQYPQTFMNLLTNFNITSTEYNNIIPTYMTGNAGTRC